MKSNFTAGSPEAKALEAKLEAYTRGDDEEFVLYDDESKLDTARRLVDSPVRKITKNRRIDQKFYKGIWDQFGNKPFEHELFVICVLASVTFEFSYSSYRALDSWRENVGFSKYFRKYVTILNGKNLLPKIKDGMAL